MKKILRFVLAVFLVCPLLAVPSAAEGRYPEKEHLPVHFSEMAFTGFDETNLRAAVSRLEALSRSGALEKKDSKTREQVQALFTQILEETDLLFTQNALAEIQYDANGANQDMADASAEIAAQVTELSDVCFQALRLLVDTPYQDVLEADAGKETAAALRDYEPLTERQATLLKEEQRLVQQYDQVMAKPVEVVFEGEAWTEESIETADLDAGTYLEIAGMLEESRNEEAGEIFRQLVQVRTEIAQDAGYDHYAECAYVNTYNRDYSVEDIQTVWEDVKTYILPLRETVLEDVTNRDIRNLELRGRASGEEILDALQSFLHLYVPELSEAYNFMRKYGLYDIEYSGTKLPTGYTVGLPAYGTAFVFNSPYGDYQDYSDMVHEFGHYNETFHSIQRELWADFNIDVGEIHSQALELFFTSYADEIFGPSAGTYRKVILCNILDSVLEGCMYDEFQVEVYQNPDMTLEEINQLFKEVSEDYGYYYEPDETESYFWIDISHTFQSPMYYISYATSALSSLDLWLWFLEDEDAAVETYMDLTVLSLSVPYREAVGQTGLRDIFQKNTIPELAEELEAYLEGKPVRRAAGRELSFWFLVPAVGLAAAFALPYTAIRRHREAAAASRAGEPWEL